MLAIDFGTSRTKVAYFDADKRKAVLASLGSGDQVAFPTLFYVGADGNVFVGTDALDYLDSDPGGVVRRVKSKLRDRALRVNGQSVRPASLVARLLATIRARVAEEVPAFGGKAPTSVVLTLPAAGAGSGPVVEKLMRDAAKEAGFTDVELITEPEGAAIAWQREEGGGTDEVVVILDGGGGTVDWACLRRVDGTLRLFADCPPGGDDKVGGEYLDEDIFSMLTAKLETQGSATALERVHSQENKWFAHVRKVRERFNRTGKVSAIDAVRVDGAVVTLDDDELVAAIRGRFTDQVCDGFGRYLDSVRAATGVSSPRVLLVGGTGQIVGLKDALRERCRCEPVWWQLSEFAPALGAAWKSAELYGDGVASEEPRPTTGNVAAPGQTGKVAPARAAAKPAGTDSNQESPMESRSESNVAVTIASPPAVAAAAPPAVPRHEPTHQTSGAPPAEVAANKQDPPPAAPTPHPASGAKTARWVALLTLTVLGAGLGADRMVYAPRRDAENLCFAFERSGAATAQTPTFNEKVAITTAWAAREIGAEHPGVLMLQTDKLHIEEKRVGLLDEVIRATGYDGPCPLNVVPEIRATSSFGYELARVFAGTYTIGSPVSEDGHDSGETQHHVTLTRDYWIGTREVTQAQYQVIAGSNPSTRGDDQCLRSGNASPPANDEPAYCLSWLDPVKFANLASVAEGIEHCYEIAGDTPTWPKGPACIGYRLPTEAEWEIAARGGEAYMFAGSDMPGAVGWTQENSNSTMHPVAQLASNGYGLYDMTGNVSEWTWDAWDPSGTPPPNDILDPTGPSAVPVRMHRGGNWAYPSANARSASRLYFDQGIMFSNIGVRLVRTIPPSATAVAL